MVYSALVYFLRKIGIHIFINDKNFTGIVNQYVNTSNTINVTASSCFNNDCLKYNPINVIQFDCPDKIFISKNEPNSWICFDFNRYRVFPSQYTIKSIENKFIQYHPKSWVIEGSKDNTNWTILDFKSVESEFSSNNDIRTFNIEINKKSIHYRYIRLRLIGKNFVGNDILALDSFEIYGSLAKLKNEGDEESIEAPIMLMHK